MSKIFPTDQEKECLRKQRELDALVLARMQEMNQHVNPGHPPVPYKYPINYPLFWDKSKRDVYLDRLIANGYQVKAKTIVYREDERFTVVDIDKRIGK